MPSQQELAARTLAQSLSLQLRALKDQLATQLIVEWLDLPTRDKVELPVFLEAALPLVEDAFTTAFSITEATNSAQGYLLLGEDFSDVPVNLLDVMKQLRGGVPLSEVYVRPFVNYWTALKSQTGGPGSLEDALSSGANRFRQLVDSDIDRLSDFTGIEKFANEHGIVGYRRVLVGPVNCALCIVASTQRYHKRQLKPMHPRCDCTVAPVLSFESDGDQVLDGQLLDQIHRDVQEKFGDSDRSGRAIDYRKILSVREHGELGPQLTWRGDAFTGPAQLTR